MEIHKQFIRYATVGLASNAIGYALYILLTYLGFGPKFAMSLLYCIGILQTFVFNKKWSFCFDGAATPALIRYATVYLIGYLINLAALILLVDQAGLPHQWIQGMMIFFVAIFLFIMQRYWVFARAKADSLA